VTNMSNMFRGSLFNGNLSKWNISSVTSMQGMFSLFSGMSSENYDTLLIGWSTLETGERVNNGVVFAAPGTYSCRAAAARDILTGTYNWTITGDELISIRPDVAALPEVTKECRIRSAAELTIPTVKIGCVDGVGATISGTTDAKFPITSDTVITWTFTDSSKSITQKQKITITDCPFITTWETTSANEMITIPTASGSTYNYTVNWGDGSTSSTNQTGDASHTYANPGIYEVTIKGVFPRIIFGDNSTSAGQIRTIERWGEKTRQWTDMAKAFIGCTNLTIADDAGVPDLSTVTDMESMFSNASLTGDLSKWNVSSVTDMSFMFSGSSFTGDISGWDVSNVTEVKRMFENSDFNGDLSAWNISAMTTMNRMLTNSSMSSENYDTLLIGWSTLSDGETKIPEDITFGAPAKYSCRGAAARAILTGTYNWDISGDEQVPIQPDVATLPDVTAECKITSLIGLSVPTANSNCDGTGTTINAATDAAFPITSDTVITWTYTNSNGKSIVQTQQIKITPCPFVTTWQTMMDDETITIPTKNGALYNYTVDWGDKSTDTSVYIGRAEHTYAKAGTYPVTIRGTFSRIRFASNRTSARQVRSVEQWGDQKWTSMELAFARCDNLTISDNAGTPDLSEVKNMRGMFYQTLVTGGLSEWDVSSAADMSYMFFQSIFNGDLSEWDVSSATDMSFMFYQSGFNQDISEWDVSSVTNMEGMFAGELNDEGVVLTNQSFNQDLSGWDISSVTNMESMLSGSSMDAKNYDKLLIGWSKLTQIPTGITFGAPAAYTCVGEAARGVLTEAPSSWTIEGDALQSDGEAPVGEMETLPAKTFECAIGDRDALMALIGTPPHCHRQLQGNRHNLVGCPFGWLSNYDRRYPHVDVC